MSKPNKSYSELALIFDFDRRIAYFHNVKQNRMALKTIQIIKLRHNTYNLQFYSVMDKQ